MFNIFRLKDEIKQNYANRGKDKWSVIPAEDLNRINSASSYMWKVPLLLGSTYVVVGKILSMIQLPELLRNPLKESVHVNENVTNTFRKAFKMQGLAMVGLLGFAIGLGLCEASKYSMFLKYQNLVNSYVQAKNREWRDMITFKDATYVQ